MEKTVAQYIEENKSVVKTLVKAEQLPASVIRSHQIYSHYCALKGESKMDKYERTASDMGVSSATVRNAVRGMQKPI